MKLETAEPVARGRKIEFRILTSQTYRNPFDPAEIEVGLEVTTPSGARKRVPCFFHQPYERQIRDRGGRKEEWLYPSGPPDWRGRFAAEETGLHTVVASRKDAAGRMESLPVTFECTGGPSRGYVKTSPRDPRFLEFSDGSPFFPIGQNLAFIGDSQYLNGIRVEEVFGKLTRNGANFARVWVCCEDWALAIEAPKSAWGRSWGGRTRFVPVPFSTGSGAAARCLQLGGTNAGNVAVSPTHAVALRPGTAYQLSADLLTDPGTTVAVDLGGRPLGDPMASAATNRWSSFSNRFTTASSQWWLGDLKLRVTGPGRAWLGRLSLQEAGGGQELLWEADPNRPERGVYNQPDCFLLDRLVDAAERHGLCLQLCLLTRDLYRPYLGRVDQPEYQRATDDASKFLRHAIARWGYSPAVAVWEYFNEMDPNAPADAFYGSLGDYFQKTDPWKHPRTTSAWGPAPRDWAHPAMDIAQLHWYLRPVWGKLSQDEVAGVLDRARLLLNTATNRPALLAEFGLADDKWGLSPYMRQDKEGVHFHNALWASAFSGLSGSAMFWWWEVLDQNDLYYHYRPLANFVDDIPFTTARLNPLLIESRAGNRVLAWKGHDRFYGWVFNPAATWWKQVVEKKVPQEVRSDSVSVTGLAPGGYRLEWVDPWTGKTIEKRAVRTADSSVTLPVPAFVRDVALKLVKAP